MADIGTGTDELLGTSQFPDYNPEERRYSVYVRDTLMKLLRGDSDELELLARYHREPERLGVLPVPESIDAKALRFSKVEEILSNTLRFLHDGTEGGPIAQTEDRTRGVVLQQRDFPTRFPHIVIQRTDSYDQEQGDAIESRWCAHRLQNQRHNIRVNRVLDALNLGLELLRFAR